MQKGGFLRPHDANEKIRPAIDNETKNTIGILALSPLIAVLSYAMK